MIQYSHSNTQGVENEKVASERRFQAKQVAGNLAGNLQEGHQSSQQKGIPRYEAEDRHRNKVNSG